MDFPSFQQLFQIARNEALIRSAPLSQDAIDREGSDANILVAAATAAADEVIGQLVNTSAGLFLDSASGTALDRLLFDRYGLTRKIAANALGSVTFTANINLPSDYTILAGTKLKTVTGIGYETVGNFVMQAGTKGPLYVSVRSLLAGADQQAKIGTITNIAGQMAGIPTGVQFFVTNPVATAGAVDQETDAEFRERGRAFFTTVQRGTLRAIEQGALTVPGVTRASAYEILDPTGRPARLVSLVIADKFTDTLADYAAVPPTYESQSKVLAESVFNALEDYRPAGVFVQVQLAQVVLLPVSLALSFAAGVNIDTVATNARATVTNVINNLNPGDDITAFQLVQALKGVQGLVVTEDDLLNPGNIVTSSLRLVATTPLQLLRTSLNIVRASSSNPNTPIGTYLNPDGV